MKRIFRWAIRSVLCPPRIPVPVENNVYAITADNNIFLGEAFEVQAPDGILLKGMYWRIREGMHPKACLIYLHSLGANHCEALHLVPFLVSKDLSVCSFDFPGCGISGGDHVPLNSDTIQYVVTCHDFLEETYGVEHFAIWGRSLGAAAALQTASTTNMFACLIADSSYACVDRIIADHGEMNGFPRWALKAVVPTAKRYIGNQVGVDVDSLSPLADIISATTPLLMGHSKDDNLFPVQQAIELFEKYGYLDKQLNIFEGRHNSVRPSSWYETAEKFIFNRLGLPNPERNYYHLLLAAELHRGTKEDVYHDLLGDGWEDALCQEIEN